MRIFGEIGFVLGLFCIIVHCSLFVVHCYNSLLLLSLHPFWLFVIWVCFGFVLALNWVCFYWHSQ